MLFGKRKRVKLLARVKTDCLIWPLVLFQNSFYCTSFIRSVALTKLYYYYVLHRKAIHVELSTPFAALKGYYDILLSRNRTFNCFFSLPLLIIDYAIGNAILWLIGNCEKLCKQVNFSFVLLYFPSLGVGIFTTWEYSFWHLQVL